VKSDREGATDAFTTVLKAIEAEWHNMDFYLRARSYSKGDAEDSQKAAIADVGIAHDIVTAFADAFGDDVALDLKKRFRELARRLDP